MAIRTIEYAVSVNGIVPASQQFGGTQGDHNVTELKFTLSEPLRSAITSSAQGAVVYRFDGFDGSGGLRSTEPKELTEEPCVYVLEEWITRYGGKVQVYLVITDVTDGTEMELYSFPAVLNIKDRPDGKPTDGSDYDSISTLYEGAKASADKAEDAAARAEQVLEDIGGAIPDIDVTEVSDGVEITVSDSDGIQTVKVHDGEKGPQGDKGDKGDTGPQGPKGDKGDPSDVSSDFVSNALKGSASGKAVAVKDVSPLPHDVTVKVSGGDTEGGEVLTKTETLSTKDAAVLLDNPASSVRVVVSGGAYCVGGLVPMVDGDDLTVSNMKDELVLWPTWSYTEASGNYDLVYTVSGNVLSWSGTKYYMSYDGVIEQSEAVSGSVELSTTGQKITGFCQVYGLDEDNPYAEYPEWDELNMTVEVYEGTSSVQLTVLGKNLIPYPYATEDTKNGITFTPNADGTITINGQNDGTSFSRLMSTLTTWSLPAGDYTIHSGNDNCFAVVQIKRANSSLNYIINKSFTLNEGDKVEYMWVQVAQGNITVFDNVVVKPQLECGTVATEFEPYREPVTYTPNSDGEISIASVYPSMTLIPETEGVTLSVEYNRDINKAFAELQAAIISMGGNV